MRSVLLLIVAVLLLGAPLTALAQDAPAAAAAAAPAAEPAPSELEQRVADLEAYVNNGARGDAATSKVAGVGPGHNTFIMICAALVLFMTLPGLALFYGGLVRTKNVLSVMAQCLGMACFIPLLWWLCGYSIAFSSGSPFFGDMKFALFAGVDSAPNTDYMGWVSQNVFAMFQLMFAIITPALIVGAIAERMKYSALMLYLVIWMFVVYFPLAHMVWGVDGFMNGLWNAGSTIKAIDFAGGTVVHMSSGWSALILCLILGKRQGFGSANFTPHSLVLCMVGTGMLWVGWYGFNAGSAGGSDGLASNAFATTTLCAAIGGGVWAALEWVTKSKPTVLGFCSGIVGGLVVITPGAGFVSPTSAVIMGVLAGVVPFYAVTKLKAILGYDDALDTFGIHGVGGMLGAFLTGVFADPAINSNLDGDNMKGVTIWVEQLKAIGLTLVLSCVATAVIAYAIKAVIGLRPTAEDEESGLDIADHGERGYNMTGQG